MWQSLCSQLRLVMLKAMCAEKQWKRCWNLSVMAKWRKREHQILTNEAVSFGGWLIRYWMFAILFTLLNGHVGAMCHAHSLEVSYTEKNEHQLRVWFEIFCRILVQKIQCAGSHKILSTIFLSQALSWCKGKEKSTTIWIRWGCVSPGNHWFLTAHVSLSSFMTQNPGRVSMTQP